MEHLAIEHLAGTPDIFRQLMLGVTEEQTTWKPAPDRWSLAEVLEHLSHLEGHLFRARVDLMTTAENPPVEGYDQNAFYAAGTYSDRDPEESFAHWEEQREDNVEFLRSLDQRMLARTGQHAELGRFTLEDLLNEWAFHDLGHVRQVAELVRAQLYYPKLGPFQAETKVNP